MWGGAWGSVYAVTLLVFKKRGLRGPPSFACSFIFLFQTILKRQLLDNMPDMLYFFIVRVLFCRLWPYQR